MSQRRAKQARRAAMAVAAGRTDAEVASLAPSGLTRAEMRRAVRVVVRSVPTTPVVIEDPHV